MVSPFSVEGMRFNAVDKDITIFSDVRRRAAAGNFLHVPMLGGTTAQEGDIFVVEEELLTTGIVIPGVTQTVSDIVTKVVPRSMLEISYNDFFVSGGIYLSSGYGRIRSFTSRCPYLAIPIPRSVPCLPEFLPSNKVLIHPTL